MYDSLSLLAEQLSDLALRTIAILAVALLVIQTIYLVVFTLVITKRRAEQRHK